MISIAASWLLIPLVLFLAVFVFFTLVNISHLLRYGASSAVGFIVTIVFVSVSAGILFFGWQMLADVDWGATYPLIGSAQSYGIAS